MPSEFKRTRSWLYTPATRPDRFAKAGQIGADVLIIDLEDAVSPGDKPKARDIAFEYLSRSAPDATLRALRINALDTMVGIADLNVLLASSATPDFIVVPKADSPGHLHILDRLLTANGSEARLVGLIESARGLANVEAIAAATPRVFGLMLGAGDMAADLGASTAWAPLVAVRSRLVLACVLAGVTPIDSPFFDMQDLDGLVREATDAVSFGFAAKAAIHPHQVSAINQALTPSDRAVEHAKAVLAANMKGVGVVNGQMVDEAIARKARRTLAAAGH